MKFPYNSLVYGHALPLCSKDRALYDVRAGRQVTKNINLPHEQAFPGKGREAVYKGIDHLGFIHTFTVSPFDPLAALRHRLRLFFDFDHQVECFVPEPRRKYGYFSHPILVGDTFVGRMDAKTNRKERILTLKNLHFEPVKLTPAQLSGIGAAIQDFARFNQCTSAPVKSSNHKKYVTSLKLAPI